MVLCLALSAIATWLIWPIATTLAPLSVPHHHPQGHTVDHVSRQTPTGLPQRRVRGRERLLRRRLLLAPAGRHFDFVRLEQAVDHARNDLVQLDPRLLSRRAHRQFFHWSCRSQGGMLVTERSLCRPASSSRRREEARRAMLRSGPPSSTRARCPVSHWRVVSETSYVLRLRLTRRVIGRAVVSCGMIVAARLLESRDLKKKM